LPTFKNDQAFVEQIGAVVRRMVGYRRFEGLEAAALLAELYRSVRLFVNFFQPSFKLIGKQRVGAHVRKSYSAPATPHQRLAADPHTSDAVRARLQAICANLDPVASLRDIRSAQQRLVDLADVKSAGDSTTAAPPSTCSSPAFERPEKMAPLDRRTGRSSKRSEVVVALIRSFRRPLSCWTGSGPSHGEPAPSS
jgi:hypothetical protein